MTSKKTCDWKIISLRAVHTPFGDPTQHPSKVYIQRTNPDDGQLLLVIRHQNGTIVGRPEPIDITEDCEGEEPVIHTGEYQVGYEVAVALITMDGTQEDYETAIFERAT